VLFQMCELSLHKSKINILGKCCNQSKRTCNRSFPNIRSTLR